MVLVHTQQKLYIKKKIHFIFVISTRELPTKLGTFCPLYTTSTSYDIICMQRKCTQRCINVYLYIFINCAYTKTKHGTHRTRHIIVLHFQLYTRFYTPKRCNVHSSHT